MDDFYVILSLVLIFLLIYPFVIYPFILFILSKLFSKSVEKKTSFSPEITVVIAAFNEEEMIEDCIRSIFESDYPSNKISVLVGSDGSTDKTISILKKLQKEFPNIQYFGYPRSGKNQVLNNLRAKIQTEFTYFIDADLRLSKNTLHILSSYFSSEDVAGVFSPLEIYKGSENTAGGSGELFYQKFEIFLRYYESEIHSAVNSYGACMLRTSDIPLIENDNVADDFYYILSIMAKGKRVIFTKETIISERRDTNTGSEFKRHIRLISGGLATVKSMSSLLHPSAGWSSFFLWSHKMIRWASPLFLILIFILSMLMEKSNFREILFLAQYFLYISAFAGYVFELTKVRFNIFKIPLFYITMNISFVYGIIRFLMQKQNAIWDRSGLS